MAQFQLPPLQIAPLYFSISEKGMLLSLTTHSSVLSPFHLSAAPSPMCLFNSPCPVALLLVVTVKSVLVRSKAIFPFLKATILLFATSRAPLPTYGTCAALGPPISVDVSSSTRSSTILDHKPQVTLAFSISFTRGASPMRGHPCQLCLTPGHPSPPHLLPGAAQWWLLLPHDRHPVPSPEGW